MRHLRNLFAVSPMPRGAGEHPQYKDVQVSMTSQDVTLVIDLVHVHCGVSPRLFDEQDVLVSALVTGRDRF